MHKIVFTLFNRLIFKSVNVNQLKYFNRLTSTDDRNVFALIR